MEATETTIQCSACNGTGIMGARQRDGYFPACNHCEGTCRITLQRMVELALWFVPSSDDGGKYLENQAAAAIEAVRAWDAALTAEIASDQP